MDSKKFLSEIEQLRTDKKKWSSVSVLLAVSQIALVIFVITKDYSEKIILLPSHYGLEEGSNREIWVDGEKVSPGYIERITDTFSQKRLTFSPENAGNQFKFIVRNAHPSVYGELQAKYLIDEERIRKNQISSVFYPLGIHVAGMTGVITGELVTMMGRKIIGTRKVHYQLDFQFQGKIFLWSMFEVKKGSNGEYIRIYEEDEMNISNLNESRASKNEAS